MVELSVEVDPEAAEAVSELFNRYNGGGYAADNEAGEAGGGGAVIEATGFDDFAQPIQGEYRLLVKTYLKPGARGQQIRQQIEDGLAHLSMLYPIPPPQVRTLETQDWAHAWKQFYKPLRVGKRVLLKPSWEPFTPAPEDLVVELDPGMAFGTGLHPSTRLCIAALEQLVRPGDGLLDLGTGSGVLAIVGAKLGAASIVATDIDAVAVAVARENCRQNGLTVAAELEATAPLVVTQASVPAGMVGRFQVVVANILAEILVKLLDGDYGNEPLAAPVAPGGALILAGIIAERADEVLAATSRHGLALVQRLEEGDWVALVVRKP